MRALEVKISATEMPQFRRLVRFLVDVEDTARVNADEELLDLVADCRRDLHAEAGR